MRARTLLIAFLWAIPAVGAPRPLGLNVHDSAGVGLDATRDAFLGTGPKFVRIDVNWFDVEKSQGQYDWTVIDAVVDGAKQRGLQSLAVLAYTPAWASSGDTKGGGTLNDVPQAGTYGSFVTAAVNHLKNRVTYYEIWNEPNLGGFFEGTPSDYNARILIPGADALHAACNTCKVVAPGLASVGGAYDTWMDQVLAGALAKIDIVSGPVYSGFPQDGAGNGTTSDSFYNKLENHRVLKFGNTIVYEGPISFKEVMDKYKVQKPFWLTETGREANLGNQTEEQAQLAYYRHVLESMLVRPWWEATIFYESFDEPPAPYRWGVCVDNPMAMKGYDPKAVMGLLQKATSQQPVFGGNGTDCSDGLDNDNDGKIDFPADPDCKSASTMSEGVYMPPVVDGGADSGIAPDNDGGSGSDNDGGIGGNGSGGGCSVGGGGSPSWSVAIVLGALGRRRRARR